MSEERYDPPITWFKLSPAVHNMIMLLDERKDSAVFREIWKAELKPVVKAGSKLTVDQIEQSIWKKSNSIWEAFCRGMVSTCS